MFVEPFAHPCHLERKVSLGRQFHDNRSHLALQPQWTDGATPQNIGEEAAPGWGTSPTPLQFGLSPTPQPDPSLYTPSVRETSAARVTTRRAFFHPNFREFSAPSNGTQILRGGSGLDRVPAALSGATMAGGGNRAGRGDGLPRPLGSQSPGREPPATGPNGQFGGIRADMAWPSSSPSKPYPTPSTG